MAKTDQAIGVSYVLTRNPGTSRSRTSTFRRKGAMQGAIRRDNCENTLIRVVYDARCKTKEKPYNETMLTSSAQGIQFIRECTEPALLECMVGGEW